MEVRLGRMAERRSGATGDGACDVYPPRLVTVVRDRYSAGEWARMGLGLTVHLGVGVLYPCGCSGPLIRWSNRCGSL